MITIERLGEVLRKFKAIVDMETNSIKKAEMTFIYEAMQEEYKVILATNEPCPKNVEADLEIFFSSVEKEYDKIAAN